MRVSYAYVSFDSQAYHYTVGYTLHSEYNAWMQYNIVKTCGNCSQSNNAVVAAKTCIWITFCSTDDWK